MISLMNFLHANLFYITLAIFVAGNIIVEWLRRRTENFLQQPLSDFLTGRYGWIQSLAYLIFGLGLAWLGYITHISLYYVAAVAIGFVVATKWDYYYHPRQGWIEHAHIISAGIAYTGAILGVLMTTWHTGGLANGAALAAVAVAFLVNRFVPGNTKLEEASVAGCLMVSLYAMVLA